MRNFNVSPMNARSAYLALKPLRIFKGASDSDLIWLSERTKAIALNAGQILIEEGSPAQEVYVLIHGTVGIFFSGENQTDILVKIFGEPAFFGEMELVVGSTRKEYVKAMESSVVLKIDGSSFLHFVKKNPQACFELFEDVAIRLCIAAENERALAYQSVEERLAIVLLSFVDIQSKTETNDLPQHFNQKYSYSGLANCLGVSEKSIERTINKWMKDGWIARIDGKLTIVNQDRLNGLAHHKERLLSHRMQKKG